jgi:hypothetical protein
VKTEPTEPTYEAQKGGGLLAVVTVLGVVMVLVQGGVYYRAQGSAKFVGAEKNKILAQQMAEAGVEDNIADLGTRKLRVTPSMTHYPTYDHKSLGGGSYSSQVTTVATGSLADTVDLTSTGTVGTGSQTVKARLRLKKHLDTARTVILHITPDTTYTYSTHTSPDTLTTTTVKDPNTMPAVNTTPAYTACMASSSKKCDICHLPGGDLSKANVINVSKSAIGTHVSHHGDYVTTDGSCDMYNPSTVITVTTKVVPDTTRHITDHSIYDTTLAIDTVIKVQFLSWK